MTHLGLPDPEYDGCDIPTLQAALLRPTTSFNKTESLTLVYLTSLCSVHAMWNNFQEELSYDLFGIQTNSIL